MMDSESFVDNRGSQSTLIGEPTLCTLEQQILDFFDHRCDGAGLFDALYGDTLGELLPFRTGDVALS